MTNQKSRSVLVWDEEQQAYKGSFTVGEDNISDIFKMGLGSMEGISNI